MPFLSLWIKGVMYLYACIWLEQNTVQHCLLNVTQLDYNLTTAFYSQILAIYQYLVVLVQRHLFRIFGLELIISEISHLLKNSGLANILRTIDTTDLNP